MVICTYVCSNVDECFLLSSYEVKLGISQLNFVTLINTVGFDLHTLQAALLDKFCKCRKSLKVKTPICTLCGEVRLNLPKNVCKSEA